MTTVDYLAPAERPKRDRLMLLVNLVAGLLCLVGAYVLASAAAAAPHPYLAAVVAVVAIAFLCGGVLLLIAPTRVQGDQ